MLMRKRIAPLALVVITGLTICGLAVRHKSAPAVLAMSAQALPNGGEIRSVAVGHEFRQDDWPSLAVARDGSVWVAWFSFGGDRDDLAIRRYRDGKWGAMLWVPGTSGDSWMPQVAVDAGDRVWVVWSQQVEGNWDIYSRCFDPAQQKWMRPQRLSSHARPDIYPRLAVDGKGRFAVVWQSFREKNSNIFLARFDDGRWSPEIRVTNHAANDWFPSVALDSSGTAWVAYDSYRNGNYDVFLSRVRPDGAAEEMPVAATPLMEAQATVAVDTADRVWIAWETAPANWGKDVGYVVRQTATGQPLGGDRKARVRCLAGSQWKDPAEFSEAFPGEVVHQPHIFSDARGSVWVVAEVRKQKMNARGVGQSYWEYWATHLEGNKWSTPFALPESRGRSSTRMSATADNSGQFWFAWPTDGRQPGNFHRPLRQRVFAGAVKAPAWTGEPVWRTPEPETPAVAPALAGEPADIAACRGYSAVAGGKKLRLLRGDFHRHTELSWDGGGTRDGSLPEFYRYMIDAAGLDFGASTDHQGGAWPYWWWYTQKMTDMFHVPGAYVAIYGYERSPQWPKGNRNIFWAKRSQTRITPLYMKESALGFGLPQGPNGDESGVGMRQPFDNDTELLYDELRNTNPVVIAHTTGTFMGTDWKEYDGQLEPVVEIFQGARTSYEKPGAPLVADPVRDAEHIKVAEYHAEGMVSVALAKGYRLGIIASSDHGSTHISYAMVYTGDPTREGILDAFRKRHTYGATDNIILDTRMGEYFMGDEFSLTRPQPIQVKARGTAKVVKVCVVKDSHEIYTTSPQRQDVQFSFTDLEGGAGRHTYYVRLEQENGMVAWSSPFFVTYR
jgi:hypothetical protein